MKKRGVLLAIATVLFGFTLVMSSGCGSDSNYSGETNETELGSENFAGSTFSYILNGLAQGMLNKAGAEIMGNLLSLLGLGSPDNSDEITALANIDKTLEKLSKKLDEIKKQLGEILIAIDLSEKEIINEDTWPSAAIDSIQTSQRELNLTAYSCGGLCKPGQVSIEDANETAMRILNTNNIENSVQSIADAFAGNFTPILRNYVALALDQIAIHDDNLTGAYLGLETLTSRLMNNQIMGVNAAVEAMKIYYNDHNATARNYLNEYNATIREEVDNIDNPTSFIHNALSLILLDAPLYGQFMPDQAASILKRAEFYRRVIRGKDQDKPWLSFFHIRTSDIPAPQATMYIIGSNGYDSACDAEPHTLTGKTYDHWEGDTVTASTDYNLTVYNCIAPLNVAEQYTINTVYDGSGTDWGTMDVNQYDTGYDKNSSGPIKYGFNLFTYDGRIDNHFTKDADLWYTQVPSADNYYSSYEIHLPDSWSIVTKAYGGDYESKARVELDGYFKYGGTVDANITVEYSMQFYVDAYSPFTNSEGGGDAYAYYKIGVWDHTAGEGKVLGTDYRLHAGSGHNYSETKNVDDSMKFTAEPNHTYYVYINMISEVDNPNGNAQALSNLNSIRHIHIRFDD